METNNRRTNNGNNYGGSKELGPGYNYSAIKFYSDNDKQTVNVDLFKTEAELIAQDWIDMEHGKFCVTDTQLRKFFNEVKEIQRISLTKGDFENQKARLYMLNAKVSYATARADRHSIVYYKHFQNFVKFSISKVDDYQDFCIFVDLFEAVYGFYYALTHKKQ